MTEEGTGAIPVIVRSRQELEAQGVSFLPQGSVAASDLPIMEDGTTYSMAQEAAWIDSQHFAVGRWDGSLSIFAFNQSRNDGPLITTAVSNPSSEGVQMITWLAPGVFVTSYDEYHMIVWSSPSGDWKDLQQFTVPYNPSFGAANSGTSLAVGASLYLIVGHANGYVTIWESVTNGDVLQWVISVDVRSAKPVNPWNLFNVRGVAPISTTDDTGYVVTGSEDGDLCVIEIPSGQILSRTVYNPNAQRGINSIATLGTDLLVANCSVGSNDFNLWYYSINSDWSITLNDSTNLKVNPNAPQVFNFDVIWALYSGGICFFSSTEEGALWMGTIDPASNKLSLTGYQTVTTPLGSALAFMIGGNLILVSYNLYEFTTGPIVQPSDDADPGRLPQPKLKEPPHD